MNEENNLNTQTTTETSPVVENPVTEVQQTETVTAPVAETPVVEGATKAVETPIDEVQQTETLTTPVAETPVVEQPIPVAQQPASAEQPNIQQQPTPNQNPVPNNNITPAKKNGHNLIVIIIVSVIVAALIFVVVAVALPKEKDNDKKDDNQQEENKKDENKKDEEEDKKDSSYIEGDWTSMKFYLDGHTYTLTSSVQDLINNGWDFDPEYLKEIDSLDSMHKTYTTIPLLNSNYSDSDVRVALINKTSETKKLSECTFWNINISNDWIDTPVEFSLPGGIKNGSTLAEIEQVYGKPEEDSIYRSESLKYYSYTYEEGDILLELTIYDDKGLTEFNFKYYG